MNATSIPLTEAKNKLSELIDRVCSGEEVTITRHDRDVARLVPVEKQKSRETGLRAIERMRKMRELNVLNPPGSRNKLTIRDLINEGRQR